MGFLDLLKKGLGYVLLSAWASPGHSPNYSRHPSQSLNRSQNPARIHKFFSELPLYTSNDERECPTSRNVNEIGPGIQPSESCAAPLVPWLCLRPRTMKRGSALSRAAWRNQRKTSSLRQPGSQTGSQQACGQAPTKTPSAKSTMRGLMRRLGRYVRPYWLAGRHRLARGLAQITLRRRRSHSRHGGRRPLSRPPDAADSDPSNAVAHWVAEYQPSSPHSSRRIRSLASRASPTFTCHAGHRPISSSSSRST